MWERVIGFFVLVVQSIGNIRKIWRLTRWETKLSQQAKQLDDEKRELQELVEIKQQNIKNINNLVTVRADYINFVLNSPQPAVEVQFLVENRSIFDLKMVKFLSKVSYQAQDIGELPAFVEEKAIGKQSGYGFLRQLPLSATMVEELEAKERARERSHWQFATHAYFTWDFEQFEKEQQVSITK